SAKQGFWNGATPPLGYKIVEAEKRGSKIKKKLDIDPVEAELVRLIFELYTDGPDHTGALGIKETTKWLNSHGYRTRKGATFGIGPVHGILKNACYATGKWPYGKRNSRTGDLHDPSTVIEVDVPPIIPVELFEKAQAKLTSNHPKVTAPRIVNGPVLLTGLAVCASCGSGMTRTGTKRDHRSYKYYTCAGCHQKGKAVCKGRHVPMEKLDTLIIDNVKDQLLSPARIEVILSALVERQSGKDKSVQDRKAALEKELKEKDDKLKRLYRAIEDGVIELDGDIGERIKTLKHEREIIKASIERIAEQSKSTASVTPEKIEAFARLMQDKLENGDIQARKAYLRAVISTIEVDDHAIRIIGDKSVLAAAIAGKQTASENVRGFVRKWRTRHDSNV
ncbi:MAG: recombinase family protein, partial [Alphaproteobacteria bacterium]|nr:recombinase family protein [Alphaproteobacteria bacterium]